MPILRRLFALLALAPVVSGLSCGPSLSALGAKGVKDLECPEQSIEWVALDKTVVTFRATGCGREAFYHEVCTSGGACDYENVLTGLRGRASFAMWCPGSELDLLYLDGLSYGVSGCEKRLIFAYDCHAGAGCSWRQEVASDR
jgi:hypothetical protein